MVAGMVTGSYMIEDLRISVPHQVAVYVPAEQAYKSKDFWRGISQRRLFLLTGGSGLAVEPDAKTPLADETLTEAALDNKKLRRDLERSRQQNVGLQGAIQSMQGQLGAILQVLGKFENGEIPLAVAPQIAAVQAAQAEANKAVGGEVPSFIPDDLKPDNARSNISVDAEVVEGSSVMDAAKLLRKARGGKKAAGG